MVVIVWDDEFQNLYFAELAALWGLQCSRGVSNQKHNRQPLWRLLHAYVQHLGSGLWRSSLPAVAWSASAYRQPVGMACWSASQQYWWIKLESLFYLICWLNCIVLIVLRHSESPWNIRWLLVMMNLEWIIYQISIFVIKVVCCEHPLNLHG